MRKKLGKGNHRKRSFVPACFRRRHLPDETDWLILDDDASSPIRTARRRTYRTKTWAVRGLAVALLGFTVPAGVKWANGEIFYENEEFILREFTAQSDGALSEAKMKEIANISPGMNLMEIDLGQIRTRLEKLPIVHEAVVSREMPDRISVTVQERVPKAWLSCPPLGIRPGDMERGFLMDEEGVFFRCLDLTEKVQQLPVIEVYRMDDPAEGEIMEVDGTENALELIAMHDDSERVSGLMIHAIKLRNEWSMQCVYRSGMSAKFALNDLERGLSDLQTILERVKEMDVELATVDVAVRQNIPVTFAQAIEPSALSSTVDPVIQTHEATATTPEDLQEKHLRSILNNG